MKLSTFLSASIIFWRATETASIPLSPRSGDNVPKDYQKLKDYANLVSFAYCKELIPSKLGSNDSNCPILRCQEEEYKNIEVLNLFDFNDFGSIGSGYTGIDHQNKRIILAFRGTSTNRDWLANINVPFKKYYPLSNLQLKADIECEGCKVHKGFYEFIEKHCVALIKQVAQLKQKYPDYQLVVLGHSLGGVFALLSGMEFLLMDFQPLVITYASPKVGNKAMVRFIDQLFETSKVAQQSQNDYDFNHGYIRVVHNYDMVPMLPPRELGYYHGGVEYHIEKSNLPHNPDSIHNRGQNHFSSNKDEGPVEKLERIAISLVLVFTSKEHTQYFIPITGCKD